MTRAVKDIPRARGLLATVLRLIRINIGGSMTTCIQLPLVDVLKALSLEAIAAGRTVTFREPNLWGLESTNAGVRVTIESIPRTDGRQ